MIFCRPSSFSFEEMLMGRRRRIGSWLEKSISLDYLHPMLWFCIWYWIFNLALPRRQKCSSQRITWCSFVIVASNLSQRSIKTKPSYETSQAKNDKGKLFEHESFKFDFITTHKGPEQKSSSKHQQNVIGSSNARWDEVVETLSIGFYNFYLRSYSQEL